MKEYSQIGVCGIAILVAMRVAAEPQYEEVVVSGQRNLLDQGLALGGGTQSITHSQQVSLNRTVGDWIERLPGVSLNGQGGLLQSYSIRGFSRWRIRTEVDAVPIISDRRAGNAVSFLSPELLQNATVERGPTSSLYGSGAMGGTVSLQSIDPGNPTTTLEARNNGRGLAASFSYGSDQTFGGGISVRRADRATDARGQELNTGYQQASALFKSRLPIGNQQLTLSWLPSYGKDIGKSNSEFPRQAISHYPEEKHSILSIQLEQDSRWLARVYHHYQNWSSDTVRIGSRRNVTSYQGHTVGGLFYAATDYLSGVGRYGVEWVGRRGVAINHREFPVASQTPLFTPNIDGDQDDVGIFFDHQWTTGGFNYGGGIRYDHVRQSDGDSQRRGGRFNASASAEWSIAGPWMLSAQLGSGFRFPSLTELYFNGVTPRGLTQGNPSLKPERNLGMQLGLEYHEGALSGSLHTYYNDLDDYIERYRVNDELRTFRNLDEASIQGYEAQLRWVAGDHLTHSLSYQWQRGEDKQGNWLADLNPAAFRYLLTWNKQRWQAHSDLLFRADRDRFGAGEQSLGSAIIWSLQVGKNINERWRAELYAHNILDELYLGTADEDAPYQPGRTVGVRLRWSGG